MARVKGRNAQRCNKTQRATQFPSVGFARAAEKRVPLRRSRASSAHVFVEKIIFHAARDKREGER